MISAHARVATQPVGFGVWSYHHQPTMNVSVAVRPWLGSGVELAVCFIREALEKSSESGTPVRRANDESFAERQCSTPLRIDSTTSSFVERSWDGTHCVTPETASETLGGTPPPMESATRQPENSMNCVEAAELFSLGKGRYQSPVSDPTKPATSKQKKYKKVLRLFSLLGAWLRLGWGSG